MSEIRRQVSGNGYDRPVLIYHSGWRRGEIFRLEWRDIDRAARVIRLRPELSKNHEGRVLVLSPLLAQLIERRWRGRSLGCPFVLHVNGKRIGEWRKTWTRACRVAGLPGSSFTTSGGPLFATWFERG